MSSAARASKSFFVSVALLWLGACAAQVGDEQSGEVEREPVAALEQALLGGSYGQARYLDATQSLNVAVNADGSFVNTGGTRPTITRTGTNTYQVKFAGLLQNGGNVQVSAHGLTTNNVTGGQRCKVMGWSAGSVAGQLSVGIACHSTDGTPSRSLFSLSYHRETSQSSGRRGAYVMANQSNAASYTPLLEYQWNSTGAANTITRSGAGAYKVRLPGMTDLGGNVLVTAYGSNSSYCKVTSWAPDSAAMNVGVRCFDTTGQGVDSMFTLDFEYRPIATGDHGAFLWADNPTSAGYTPQTTWSFNTESSAAITVSRLGPIPPDMALPPNAAAWSIAYPGNNFNSSVHLATAYGTDTSFCVTAPTLFIVGCMTPDGSSANLVKFTHRVISRTSRLE